MSSSAWAAIREKIDGLERDYVHRPSLHFYQLGEGAIRRSRELIDICERYGVPPADTVSPTPDGGLMIEWPNMAGSGAIFEAYQDGSSDTYTAYSDGSSACWSEGQSGPLDDLAMYLLSDFKGRATFF